MTGSQPSTDGLGRPTYAAGVARLVAAVAVILTIWLGVLPRVTSQPAVRKYLDWLERERIDPSAMYYTDLERMDEILARSER